MHEGKRRKRRGGGEGRGGEGRGGGVGNSFSACRRKNSSIFSCK
jgi:hypothetical protein